MAPAGQPLDALHLGGGGFTDAAVPGGDPAGHATTWCYEIDGELVDLDERELGLRAGPTLRASVGDARMLVGKRPAASADLVVGDAFGHLVVPWHLATREMAADIGRVTRPAGIYVQNVIDYPPLRFIRAELATVAAEFPHVALVAPPERAGRRDGLELLIVASDVAAAAGSGSGPAWHQTTAAGRSPSWTAPSSTDFVGDARVLTDDYAPVDQLLATALTG